MFPYTGRESIDYRANAEADADIDAVATACRASFQAAEFAAGVRRQFRAPKQLASATPSLPTGTNKSDMTVYLVLTVAESGAVSAARACIGTEPFAQAAV